MPHPALAALALLLVALVGLPALAQPGDATSDANNPLTPKLTVNFQDQWAPRLYGSDEWTNALLFRGGLPHATFGVPQILRATLPVATAPKGDGGTTTGLGDLNVFDLLVFKGRGVEFGVGPQLTLPTATNDRLGSGKWQAGLAFVTIVPRSWGLAGTLLTWQHSFAGDDDRPTQNNLVIQPLGIVNLPDGWYVRSSASWTFDVKRGHHAIPVGLGAGKVWVLNDGTTVNAFIEPQWTVAHDGPNQPKFQVFAGVNLQFPLRR